MRVLIGTPIHESKDYSMDRWIESVSKLDYSFDLLMVDNSPNLEYQKKIHEYCKKYGLTPVRNLGQSPTSNGAGNYKLVHIDVGRNSILDERLAQSREVIRQEILKGNYDAWCSLECDVIVPSDALTKLVSLIDDYWMVSHAYPARSNPNNTNAELGISLIKREVLLKLGFSNEYGYIDPLRPQSWYGGDVWFLRRIDRSSIGKYIHVYGLIKPIYHLNQ